MIRLIKKFWEYKYLLGICIAYTILVTVAFLYPFKGATTINFIIPIDKLIHVFIYLFLSFLWISYSNMVANYIKKVTIISMIILLCFFYGIIIELSQELFIPLRKADLFDISANMLGAFLGALLFLNVKNRIKS